MQDVERYQGSGKGKRLEDSRRIDQIATRIRSSGGALRPLGVLREDWKQLTDEFEQSFPNFRLLAEFLRDHLALHALGDRRVAFPPVLLVGPAGIGKTEAARWLASRMELPDRVFDLSTAQSNSQLCGSEAFWSNTAEGGVFELIAYGEVANPIIVLDELDKASTSARYDPLAALYTLLEPRSARQFRDLSVRDVPIDASHINWIATANEVDELPAPIMSRFCVMHVQPPSPEQTAAISASIYRRLKAAHDWGARFADALRADTLDCVAALSPRQIRAALQTAFGSAARAGRTELLPEDIKVSVLQHRRPIGFQPSMRSHSIEKTLPEQA